MVLPYHHVCFESISSGCCWSVTACSASDSPNWSILFSPKCASIISCQWYTKHHIISIFGIDELPWQVVGLGDPEKIPDMVNHHHYMFRHCHGSPGWCIAGTLIGSAAAGQFIDGQWRHSLTIALKSAVVAFDPFLKHTFSCKRYWQVARPPSQRNATPCAAIHPSSRAAAVASGLVRGTIPGS